MAEDACTSSKRSTKSVGDISEELSKMNLVSFRKIDEIKKLAHHFKVITNHPLTQENRKVLTYLQNLDQSHRNAYKQKREGDQVEYIFAPETKSNLQRQRFNSLPISEVSELLKTEYPSTENADQVHICIDCNVAIELNDEEPLMESLQKHFNLEVHLPKMKRESVDVSEPIVLPNMSRRLSAMECGKFPNVESISQLIKPSEKLDRFFLAKLETLLIRHLPDNNESNINNAIKFYQGAYDKLCQEIAGVDFSALIGTVAPIIMSIKDNVNQNFATDTNKSFENEENDQSFDKSVKNAIKKHRYYGPIENMILKLLTNHKLLPLIDDRTGKPAFFCITCEYYSLRFRYDSVLNHVFSETHIHNLACILQTDKHIPFASDERSVHKIKEMNQKFLLYHSIGEDGDALHCGLCKTNIDSPEASILHVLDDNHLSKMSDKLYRKFRNANPNAQFPEEWGQKNLNWAKYLAGTGKSLSNNDHIIIENFIKPTGKIVNYCPCCDATLKGPRQMLFNHIRQKKHLRNAAPHKLTMLYKNYARPAEYYAGFGNFYVCGVCPTYVAQPSFAGMVEHIESDIHIETIAKMIRMVMHTDEQYIDHEILTTNKITLKDEVKCEFCDVTFQDVHDAIAHVLSSVQHQNSVVEAKYQSNKGDIISIYMKGNYVLHSEGTTFECTSCKVSFSSLRSLLMHLMYAEHFQEKPTYGNVFRFYLELKHNINLLVRNKYVYEQFGKLKCGVCDMFLEEGENAKKHVANIRHRENMGASYGNVSLEVSAVE